MTIVTFKENGRWITGKDIKPTKSFEWAHLQLELIQNTRTFLYNQGKYEMRKQFKHHRVEELLDPQHYRTIVRRN